jgi:HAD superfamily hydrolase (TIGR01484 family)
MNCISYGMGLQYLSFIFMQYKALICDLDGTAIPNRHDGMPSEAVLEAISEARALVHVAAATARHYSFAEPVIKKLCLTGPSIFHNGSRIIDVTDNTILWEQTIDHSDTAAVFEIFKQANTRIVVNDDGDDLTMTATYRPKKPLSIYINNIEAAQAAELLTLLRSIPTISAYSFRGYAAGTVGVVVSHVGATKQHAIVKLAELLNIDTQDFIGIGDSHTDFPLLMACGLKVAMNNAVEDLKNIADYVAPSVEDDGVAVTIQKFLLHQR